jgi:uncharacterized membrane protein
MEDARYGAPSGEEGYSGPTVAAAVLMTLFFPLISLIAALFLLGRERSSPEKRSSLRAWAIATAVWIVVWILIVIGLFAVASSGSEVGPVQTP